MAIPLQGCSPLQRGTIDLALAHQYRYTLDRSLPPTVPDGTPGVLYGTEAPAGAVLLPPCSPSKIVCVGRNYAEHAKELGNDVPAEPLLFLKPPSSLLGHEGRIVYPSISKNVHFEGELGVIIGRRARHVKAAGAREVIRGYTCLNDVTARDIQRKDVQFTRGKGFDTFCATGPFTVPVGELDPSTARVITRVDGEVRQDAPVTDMIFSIGVLIEFITAAMTLEPGDLIATGTPPGVGPMTPGAVVEVEVTGLGVLRNFVVEESL
ncbi:MAG TPA: fumarylacetoacetate hydrolase family protein [Bryobacteraceae bacterium]|nr:fumarylacetoacetate hydrolase family protein [Bryobacteraceae bacterium]